MPFSASIKKNCIITRNGIVAVFHKTFALCHICISYLFCSLKYLTLGWSRNDRLGIVQGEACAYPVPTGVKFLDVEDIGRNRAARAAGSD